MKSTNSKVITFSFKLLIFIFNPMKKIAYSLLLALIVSLSFTSCVEESIEPSVDGGTTETKKF